MRGYYDDLLKAPKDAWSILAGLITVFGILAFVGYEPAVAPIRLVVHGWRALGRGVWFVGLLPLGVRLPDYAADGLTVVGVLAGFGLRSWRAGHPYYGRRLALSYWPWSKEFEERDWYTILAVWLQLLFMLLVLGIAFQVNPWTPEAIPRDSGHDAVRFLLGATAVIVGCFPRLLGAITVAALVLLGVDSLLPVIERAVQLGAGAT